MVNLFQLGDFTLNSGQKTNFKIEADALTEQDWQCLAHIVKDRYTFKEVFGVPRGGIPFADALRQYASPESRRILLVDDILTTGGSMVRMLDTIQPDWQGYTVQGVVVFARGPSLPWINPIFRMW